MRSLCLLSYNSQSFSVPWTLPASSPDHALESPSRLPLSSPRPPVALYPVSRSQLLHSDTGVPHFALDLLTHRSSPKSLSRCRPCWTTSPSPQTQNGSLSTKPSFCYGHSSPLTWELLKISGVNWREEAPTWSWESKGSRVILDEGMCCIPIHILSILISIQK